jgi:hypothetical protein
MIPSEYRSLPLSLCHSSGFFQCIFRRILPTSTMEYRYSIILMIGIAFGKILAFSSTLLGGTK